MQYVNDDMDELFRRAAKNYPLDTTGADWNKVASALNDPETPVVPEKKKRRFLWLFLLVPLGLIVYQTLAPADNSILLTKDRQAADHSDQQKSISVTSIPGNVESLKNGPAQRITTSVPLPGASVTAGGKDNQLTGRSSGSGNITSVTTRNFKSNSGLVSPGESIDPGYEHHTSLNNKQRNGLPDNGTGTSIRFTRFIPVNGFSSGRELPQLNPHESKIAGVEQTVNPTIKTKRFYAGIMGGVDATTIKLQRIDNAGYDAGLLLGYRLGKKWSIETGVYLNNKFYYTEGKHFNTSKISYMPPNTWITDVEGSCRMIEIPLNVRYNFSRRKNVTWFSTAGVSSYVMKKEDYAYVYYYATPGTYATHEKSYRNSSTNLLSVVSLSAGYTRRLGRAGELRIEPYVKLPVDGLGIGKLPMMSTGIHVGFTRDLF